MIQYCCSLTLLLSSFLLVGCNGSDPVNGPNGGSNPNTEQHAGKYLFAATGDGIFRSSDDGASWTEMDSGAGPKDFRCFGTQGNYIFAGSEGYGMFRSSNNGVSWDTTNAQGPATRIAVAMLQYGKRLYAAVPPWGLYATTDAGNSWQYAGSGGFEVHSLASSSAGLFMGTSDNGVWWSTDSGGSWGHSGSGMDGSIVNGLAAEGSRVLAATSTNGLWRSLNGARVWEPVSSVAPSDAQFSAFFDGAHAYVGTVYGVFVSSDTGSTWTYATGLPSSTTYAFAANHGYVFAAAGYVYRSSDNGTTWQVCNNGLKGTPIYAFGVW
ncbi:MAG: hypothetical protein Q8922_09030 [Bacteroidota bacterium]|nr:hypothetical protein [Bacteroidota bacterium]MDP4288066.1 hypothetical protein [Bacteroidota bacterium]